MPTTPFNMLHLLALAAGASASLLPRATTINVVQGNDDGWAEANIRLMYSALSSTPGYATLVSAPAINWSGSGSLDLPAVSVFFGGEYGSIAPGAPATGSDPNDQRINYVNSFPVTAMKYGLKELSTKYYGGLPDLVVTGPNVGSNTGIQTPFSGTIGAANEAVLQKVPAIAFSGASGPAKSYKDLQAGDYSHVYVDLAIKVVQTLTAKKPYLPPNIGLNVNFSAVNATSCTKASDFKFIQTRIFPNLIPFTQDVTQCGSTSLPTEGTVADAAGCTVSISGFTGGTKLDVGEDAQAYIRQKFSSLWGCL